ncbi:unnamed protein product [Ciceribacter selenitireducens ATCC BAA-1503]|uniref:Uncharacterized protein n=1 Tax=Ciceribacter selenitireducens ATCC BAA-1503 TaxID=1336235 RepID=A0A376ACD7_9HYPH|nr:unnamed protein product [Ciceribacter selenitireducens ATCC BAA-1503]
MPEKRARQFFVPRAAAQGLRRLNRGVVLAAASARLVARLPSFSTDRG